MSGVSRMFIADLVNAGHLDGSKPAVEARVRQATWPEFDDGYLLELIREMRKRPSSENERLRAEIFLNRKPPVVLAQDEDIRAFDALKNKDRRKLFHVVMKDFASKFETPPERLSVWEPSRLRLRR